MASRCSVAATALVIALCWTSGATQPTSHELVDPRGDEFSQDMVYGSIPINTIFSGMNIHLPAILMFTRGTRF